MFKDPQNCVESGVYDVLPLYLDHASQRLVKELLQCTRDLSDMSTNKLDISYLLSRLVQLLGEPAPPNSQMAKTSRRLFFSLTYRRNPYAFKGK